MAGFTVTIDDRDIRELQRQLAAMPKRIPQAIAAAINKSLGRARTVIIDGIQGATTLRTRSRIIKGTHVDRANRNKLAGRVVFDGRPVGALQFRHSVTKRGGAVYQPIPTLPPIRAPHAFRARGQVGKTKASQSGVGNLHIFQRVRKGAMRVPRLPLFTHYGPSLHTIYRNAPQVERAAHAVVASVIREQLYSQVDRFLQRSKTAVPSLDSLA